MVIHNGHPRSNKRPAAAMVELAILLPVLMALFLFTIEVGSLWYLDIIIWNCARQGAIWASDPIGQAQSPYSTLSQAALAEYGNYIWPTWPWPPPKGTNPNAPTVSSTIVANADGIGNSAVAVTVTWQIPSPPFSSFNLFPAFTLRANIQRTVTMTIAH